MSSMIEVGVAAAKITPLVGTEMSGYAGRPGPAVGVHDDLYAKALVMDDGTTRLALLTLDLLGLSFEDVSRIRSRAQQAGITPSNLMVACSHTHAGPATQPLRRLGEVDQAYMDRLVEVAGDVIAEASSKMSPASIYYSAARSDIGKYRRGYVRSSEATTAEPEDQEIGLLLVGEKPNWRAIVYNYPCHGVVLGYQNVMISADWIGAASRTIEEATSATAMFLQGCAGDINPRSGHGGFDLVDEVGGSLGRSVAAAAENAVSSDGSLAVLTERVKLPLLPPPSAEELDMVRTSAEEKLQQLRSEGKWDHDIEIDVHEAKKQWAEELIDLIRAGKVASEIEIPIQAMRIGGVGIVGIPGEAFVELGQSIKQADRNVLVASYANGNIGYIPTAEAFQEGGYEVDSAYQYYGLQMIGPESVAIIMDAARRLLL